MRGISYFLVFVAAVSASKTSVFSDAWGKSPDVCLPPLGGIKFILQMRDGYGWKENTHRANIALAVSRLSFSQDEKEKIDLHLEKRITKLLLSNSSSPISVSDLALYINALVATKRNPRNFRGIDLVKDLLERINHEQDLHPFIANTLCNAHAIQSHHLERIKKLLSGRSLHTREVEMKAMAVKAVACAASLPESKKLHQYAELMEDAAEDLVLSLQVNTTFNVYTISLIVQALNAYGKSFDEDTAIHYLRRESEIDPNVIKAYFIEMALNSKSIKFLKDLFPGPYDPEQSIATEITITISVKMMQELGKDMTVVTKVPRGWNLLQILTEASALTNRLKCGYVLDQDGKLNLFQVGEQPNDPEKDLYWRICQDPYDTRRHPKLLQAQTTFNGGERILLVYGTTSCPSEE